MPFEVVTLEQRPDLEQQVDRLAREAWPPFMLNAGTLHWGSLFDTFAGFQILLCDPTNTLIALGHTSPLIWDGTTEDLPPTIDEMMERAMEAYRGKELAALGAVVASKTVSWGSNLSLAVRSAPLGYHRSEGRGSAVRKSWCFVLWNHHPGISP